MEVIVPNHNVFADYPLEQDACIIGCAYVLWVCEIRETDHGSGNGWATVIVKIVAEPSTYNVIAESYFKCSGHHIQTYYAPLVRLSPDPKAHQIVQRDGCVIGLICREDAEMMEGAKWMDQHGKQLRVLVHADMRVHT